MSRGLGAKEHAILNYLKSSSGMGTTLETMRWDLAAPQDTGQEFEKLSASHDTALSRALKSLEEKGRIIVKKRRLRDLDELQLHYPNKTLHSKVRALRQGLLPEIIKLEKDGKGLGNRYSGKQNEDFMISQLEPSTHRELSQEWEQLERSLRAAFSKQGSEILLMLLCRGRIVFQEANSPLKHRLSVSASLSELAKQCIQSNLMNAEDSDRISSICEKLNPLNSRKELKLKSLIYSYSDMLDQNNDVKIRNDAVELLGRHFSDKVEELGGFEPKPTRNSANSRMRLIGGSAGEFRRRIPTVLLNKLFDRSVFREFRFVSLADH